MEARRTALVTGGARGIGSGIAKKMAQDGFAVAILDMLPQERAAETLNTLQGAGVPVLYFQGDITKDSDRAAYLKQVLAVWGRIDLLINNAGAAPKVRMDLLEMTEESYDFVTGINLKGTLFMTQAVARVMAAQQAFETPPMIINISSISAYASSPARGEYCISKAGVSMVTQLFADRLAEHGILVYEIRPGIIATEMTQGVKEKYDRLIEDGLLPIQRWGKPEDIAEAVSLCATGRLAYSTGQVINVDGGFHIRRL